MKLLLDTHTLLWALTEKIQVVVQSETAFTLGRILVRVAGVWEIVTKIQIGKLSFTTRNLPPSELRIAA
jgi:PIN domain nuclease of toxin-antitoxin system